MFAESIGRRGAAWIALAAFSLPLRGAGSGTPPHNVLVIVADDCGPGLIGAYDAYFQSIGRPSQTAARTPAIDSLLAAQGVTFTQVWSSPLCTPARAQLLTGRYGYRIGIGQVTKPGGLQNNPGLDPSFQLLPKVLTAAPTAYDNAALGKWHLNSKLQIQANPLVPLGTPGNRWFRRFAGTLFNFEIPPGTAPALAGYYSWDKYFCSELVPGVDPCGTGSFPCTVAMHARATGGYPTADTTDDALTMIATLPQPWFLYVGYHAIHEPLHRVPRGLPVNACGPYLPPATPCDPGGPHDDPKRARCMLEALDAQIGRLLCAVDMNSTNVIFLGDNGTAKSVVLPPYPSGHFKGSVYQGGVEIPLIVRSPALNPSLVGTRCDGLVHVVDLFATVCEMAGTSAPAGTDSVSLAPYFAAPTASLRSTLYTEEFAPNFVPDPNGWLPAGYTGHHHDQALRDARFKLMRKWRYDHNGMLLMTEELYDLQQGGPPDTSTQPPTPTPDWFEQNDLLAPGSTLSPAASAALSALRAELDIYPSVVQ